MQCTTRTTHTLTSILSLPFSLFISFFLSVCLFVILSLTHSVSRLAHQILTCMGMLNLGSFIHFISHPGKPVKFRPLTALSCSLRIYFCCPHVLLAVWSSGLFCSVHVDILPWAASPSIVIAPLPPPSFSRLHSLPPSFFLPSLSIAPLSLFSQL